ncbi:hypothetical protein KDH_77090 [Dictyobacter sp. S3.2.2.5]|uniref:DUF6915 domain-containing protein n=1 Tax=Dictyobacter halimunensis TaxID=3026934 RepID=A0ABQ6G5P2_9CHLR|nr:hypothetical protein KDH_77090 [Dictyobacter sp. S3.2.2.5]
MAHPYYHAVSSARRFGGRPDDYLQVHEFMDHTKSHLADSRHRLFLHNTWGIFFAEKILGATITRASDDKIMPLRPLLEQHVTEDFSFIPTLHHCFEDLPARPFAHDTDDSIAHCQQSQAELGGAWRDYLPIHQAFNSTRDVLADQRAQIILHNTWGITILLRLLGDTLVRPSDQREISIRPILETHIRRDLGTIPTLKECVKDIPIQPWMYRSAQPLSRSMAQ